MSLQIELLEQSFNDYIKPYGELFVDNFYENLFQNNPEIKSQFTENDSEVDKNQLWQDLVLVVENLHQPDNLHNILHGYGARLFTFGVLPEHYPLAKEALFSTCAKFLGNAWTTELQHAWNDAYVTFRKSMLDEEEKTRRQMALIDPSLGSESLIEEKVIVSASKDNSLSEDVLEAPVSELDKDIDSIVEDYVVSTDNPLAEDVKETSIPDFEEITEEDTTVTESEISSAEDVLNISVAESEEIIEEEVIVAVNNEEFLVQEASETPFAESEEALEEEVVAASTIDLIAKDAANIPPTESLEIEEFVTEETPENISDKVNFDDISSELDKNLAQDNIVSEEETPAIDSDASTRQSSPQLKITPRSQTSESPQSRKSPEAKTEKIPVANLSKAERSENIEPQVTSTDNRELRSESTATATAVQQVASEKTYETEIQPSQSKKKLLVGGGIAGAAILLLLLLL